MESPEPQGLESGFTFPLGRPDPEIFNKKGFLAFYGLSALRRTRLVSMESREPQGLESGFTFPLGHPDPEIFNISDRRKD